MNGNKLFVDTNILIYLLQGETDIESILNEKDIVISVITELELKSFNDLSPQDDTLIEQLINECQVINLNSEIKRLAIEFRKSRKLKLPDAIVAASAHYSKLPLFTADKQFEKVEELDVVIFEM
jgi:predicted nucleic acid-binding protein